ncbi:MAG TPA: helix-turn-helix domain-containing protein [Ilumatobacter sp.]|nr:helix-turn-helix domain-containing protein [Ilumatobacter sp.]
MSDNSTGGLDAHDGAATADSARLDLFKTLGDNTRYAIYLELARSPKALTTAEIADMIELHPNTVRPHLERMRDVGLVAVAVDGRGEIGRPQHRYSLASDAPSLGLEPPVMPVLARMVLSMAERLGGGADDAFATGCDEGAARALPYASAQSSLEALVSDLDRLGFDPVVAEASPDDPDAAVVAFAQCPFGDLAAQHPKLVCSLHHGLVAGFVAAMGDTEVREFCSVVDRTPCQVSVAGRA